MKIVIAIALSGIAMVVAIIGLVGWWVFGTEWLFSIGVYVVISGLALSIASQTLIEFR